MAEQQIFWNRDNEDDRKKFALILAPLVGASRTKSFTRHEGTAYILSLQDVSPEILTAAVESMVKQGVTWMPKPGDLKAECAKVMAAKRKAVAAIHLESCEHSSHFIENEQGRQERCPCWTRAQQAMAAVGQAIALPASREDQMELGQ